MRHMSQDTFEIHIFFYIFKPNTFFFKLLDLVSGGSVINGPTPHLVYLQIRQTIHNLKNCSQWAAEMTINWIFLTLYDLIFSKVDSPETVIKLNHDRGISFQPNMFSLSSS